MRKYPLTISFNELLYLDISVKSKSWKPVIRNNWLIKFSLYKHNIMLIFLNIETKETIIRFFDDEDIACDFINKMINDIPSQI